MAIPVVAVLKGGTPVTEATNGKGMPIKVATNRRGIAVTYVAHRGIPVVTVSTKRAVSISVRAKLGVTTGTAGNLSAATVPIQYYRSVHKTNVAGTMPWALIWNGAINAANGNAVWEQGPVGATNTRRMSVITGVTNPLLMDQTGNPVHLVTFLGIQSGSKEIRDLSFALRTWTDFVSAGGAVSGDNRTVTVPSGWSVEHDAITDWNPVAGEKYLYQIEDTVPGASAGTPLQHARVGPAAPSTTMGDLVRNATTTVICTDGKNLADTANWSTGNVAGVSAITNGPAVLAPSAVYALGTAFVVGIDGDSIADEKQDAVKDTDGVSHGLSRALNAGGYSFVKTAAFSSSMLNQRTYGGNAYRLGLLRFCDAVITDHSHNDSSTLVTDTAIKSLIQWHGTALKGALRSAGAKRLVRLSQTPTNTFNNGTAQAGGSTTTIVLASGSSATNGIYVNSPIKLNAGSGAGQKGIITAYDGTSKIATVSPIGSAWTVAPDATTTYTFLTVTAAWTAADPIWTVFDAYMKRTGIYAGIPFNTGLGEPDYVLSATAAHQIANLMWPDVDDTFDGTHDASPGAVKAQAYYTPLLAAALGSAP